MLNRLYIHMALYFAGIIITTLAAAFVLFFFTVGRPLARDVHAMLRSHTRYLAALASEGATQTAPHLSLATEFDRFAEHYGFAVALLDDHGRTLVRSSALQDASIHLTDRMTQCMRRREAFIQSSHFNRPLIYVVPVTAGAGEARFLYVAKQFPGNPNPLAFIGGLVLIGLLLIVAVYPLSKSITQPLTRLTHDFEKIAAGRFDAVAESTRKDEIGELIRGYRAMSQSVDRMMKSKKQLLADISHELCSPLGRIRLGTELIKGIVGDAKARNYIDTIETDIASMDHLIGNLSAFSRMNLPGFALEKVVISPHDLVAEMVALYLPSAQVTHIRLSSRTSAALPYITGDPERLKQVFTNLVDNAIHATHQGQEIVLGAQEHEDRVCFFVEDQGPGVSEADAEKIFEPLYRVDPSRNKNLGGAGLGLALARKIVELHGGELRYERIERRTRFSFYLPKADHV